MSPIKGHNPHADGASIAGFTLLELMVAMGISVVIILGVITAYLYLGRNLARLANAQTIDVAGRRTFYLFIRDVSSAKQLTNATATQITLTLSANKVVTYTYSSSAGTLVRTALPATAPEDVSDSTDPRAPILSTVTAFNFNYYNMVGSAVTPSSSGAAVKAIEFAFTTTKGVAANGTQTSYSAVSPRVLLRNKPLLQ